MIPTMKLNMKVEKEVSEATKPDKKDIMNLDAFPANCPAYSLTLTMTSGGKVWKRSFNSLILCMIWSLKQLDNRLLYRQGS